MGSQPQRAYGLTLQHTTAVPSKQRLLTPTPLSNLHSLFSVCSFQIIDSENEALLAALTETLDDIQEDDIGLAAFRTMEEGDAPTHTSTSPTPSPKPTALVVGGPPPAPEVDELSLVRTHFLLFKVDLDEPLISRLHGYDRKQRSEFFHYRLKTLNRQYKAYIPVLYTYTYAAPLLSPSSPFSLKQADFCCV